MSNFQFSQSLDGLNNIDADNATITTLNNCNLLNCTTSTTPTINNAIVNKKYVDDNFVDRTNNLTQNVNGLKTFLNNTNFTGSLLSRTNIKLSEYENTAATNTITLAFPMSETIALRTTPSTSNPMTINLPLLTNNERGYVFTFNKLFDTANVVNRNFPVTFNTSGGQGIYSLLQQNGTPTSNTTLLSVEKIQCKLAVGWFGSLLYWIEQTDFSTYDRYKLTEWENATTTNTLTLTLPLPPTIALRTSTQSTMTITLPTLTTLERGKIFTFVKVNSYNYDVIFNTSSGQWIFPLNNISGGPTTNTTIFPSNKKITRLVVGWFGTFTYWVEASDYSTFDVEQNNLIYARLASPNTFTNTNTFNNFLPTSTLTPSSGTQLTTKTYVDDNFVDKTTNQDINGVKTFLSNLNCSSALLVHNILAPSSGDNFIYTNLTAGSTIKIGNLSSTNVVEGDTTFSSDITTPNIFCDDALYLNDYQSLPSPITYSSILVQNSDILNFDANFNNNKFQFKVSSNAVLLLDSTNTTIYNNLVANSQSRFNAGSRYYSGTTNYTEVLQTGAQLTIKPVHDSGTIALFSTNTSGTRTQQLLINDSGISSPVITGTNIFSTNYNSPSGFMTIGASTETGTISLGTNLTLGNVNIGNTTAGSFKINIRGSLFSTGQATFQNFCPKSETNPSVANDLVKLSYLQNNFVDKTTDQTGIAGNKTFTGQATFNSFCPKTDTNPAVANDLVKLSYLQNNFCDRSTTQIIGGEKTFTGNTIIGSALYFTDLDDTSSLDIPNINNYDKTLYFLANNNYDNRFEFWCALNPQLSISQYSTEIKNPLIANEDATFSKDIKHRETQIINKVKTISTTSPAAFEFPLEQRWMFTTTGTTQIAVTLPELTLSSQAGFDFSFFKTASNTNSVLFTCQGTNKIRGLNSITDLTSDTRISGTGTTGGFYTAEVSTGNFVWISY